MQSTFHDFNNAVKEILRYAELHQRTTYISRGGSPNYPEYHFTFDVISPDSDTICAVQTYIKRHVEHPKLKGHFVEKNVGKFHVKTSHYESAKLIRKSAIVW